MSQNEMKEAIQSVIKDLMSRVMDRVLKEDPFLTDEHRAKKPLYAALVPDEIFKGSHFERRFVTSFGRVWEKLAVVAAQQGLGYGVQNYTIQGVVGSERLRRIEEILRVLEHPEKGKIRVKPDWDKEIAYILEGNGEPIPVTVVCDIYAEDKSNGRKYAFELKAPLPNSDQTKQSKEKMFKLHSMDPLVIDGAYYALPYNPDGPHKQDYKWAFPARWFNMVEDEVVLIGDEFWDKIGGAGTYQAFVAAVNEIGPKYREQIYKDFLGIEPSDYDPGITL